MSDTFKNNLKSLREARKLTQWDLASKLKVAQGVISIIEAGYVKPKPKVQQKLAVMLKCKVEDIWGGDDV